MSKDKGIFRWGIIGPGRIAHKFAQALRAVPGAHLHAVSGRDLSRARDFARSYDADYAYDSTEALVKDDNLDAVYIATPHTYHYEQANICLEHGKPVLVEKPVTVNAGQFQSLATLAQRKNVFLMEALWTRYLPIYQEIRQWLNEGRIGEVRLMTSTFGFKGERDPKGRLFNPQLAGGTLLDIGIYNIAVTHWVMASHPTEVNTQAWFSHTGVDELLTANLIHANGVVSQFTSTFLTECQNDFWIYGDAGRIQVRRRFWDATQASLIIDDHEKTTTRRYRLNGFEYQIEEVVDCVRTGRLESSRMTHADSLGIQQTMDRIRAQIGLRYPFE
ncbi:MAG: Gfo/Idh/MocA family oxidoreductase [Anaerolineae bacterium]|nr:Gfo/Idh/MocA family oxidoreductase [Anaerolineae bacterium]